MKTFKLLLLFSFLLTILALQTKCAKTDDVEPIVSNNDSSPVTIADDTVYINSTISGFVLNEVLYDPPPGTAGDANQDGTRHPKEDEFVEFVNNTDSCLNLSGCKIFDTEFFNLGTPNHEFPENTFINPNQAVVVFGGPQDSTFNSASFGNSLVFSSSNVVMNLNNGGDIMTFTDNSGNILIEFDISDYQADNNVNQSYTRNPDLTGLFEQHNGVSGTLFSPGTRADGTPF